MEYQASAVFKDGTIRAVKGRTLARCWDFIWEMRSKDMFSSCRIDGYDGDDELQEIYSYRANQPHTWYWFADSFAAASGLTVRQVYKYSAEWQRLELAQRPDGCELMICSDAIDWLKWKRDAHD
jgi:hypothetical protein